MLPSRPYFDEKRLEMTMMSPAETAAAMNF